MEKVFFRGIILAVITFFVFFHGQVNMLFAETPETPVLEKYYSFLNQGDQFVLSGQNQKALECYKRALSLAENDNGEVVARGSLLRFYENTSDYVSALKETEWFLKRDLTSPGRLRYRETKQRLLQKIEEQKRGEKIEEPKPVGEMSETQPVKRVSDFYGADYGSQKAFLEKELPEDTEIRSLGKQAMLEEHVGKFKEAKDFYEKMLLRQDEAVAAFGEFGWVMLHPAVQRTSEVTGDEAREKEMLIWIRDNMIAERGQYHKYLKGLIPPVRDHLKERLREYRL